MELHETEQQAAERVLLISVDTGEFDAEVSLAELAELAETAGGMVVIPTGRHLRTIEIPEQRGHSLITINNHSEPLLSKHSNMCK